MKYFNLIWGLGLLSFSGISQNMTLYHTYHRGEYKVYTSFYKEVYFQIFQFKRSENGGIKTKYLATNPSRNFYTFKDRKRVLLTCTAGFSTSWEHQAKPKGLTIAEGKVINRLVDRQMDGLVVLHNFNYKIGELFITDLNYKIICTSSDGSERAYNLKNSYDKYDFLDWARETGITAFQTQIMYFKEQRRFSYGNLYYGRKAYRRFLVQGHRGSQNYDLIVDIPEHTLYLNHASSLVYNMLIYNNYTIDAIANLDTGGKNILYVYDDYENLIFKSKQSIYDATNLIVYYFEK